MNFLLIKIHILLLFSVVLTGGYSIQVSENEMIAAFLVKITKFISWEETLEKNTLTPFVIGVKDRELKKVFEIAFQNEYIEKKKVSVINISSAEDLHACNIIFVSSSMKNELPQMVANVKGESILLVGKTRGFAELGVHLNFFIEKDKLRFEINETEINKTGLSVSHLLLRLAEIVNPL